MEMEAFQSDGSINPQWTQYISNKDPLTSEIGIYFMSGERMKKEAKCLAVECVLDSRTSSVANAQTGAPEYNPMMLCFYCNRTFHTACLDLDAHLIREEPVPWRCKDCKSDYANKHCQAYYKRTGYKDSMLKRRAEFLKPENLPEKEDKFKKDINFDLFDTQSFDRRALKIMSEEDPESLKDVTAINPLLLKQVMKARSDKKASQETAARYRAEMEKKEKEIKELMAKLEMNANKTASEKQEEKPGSLNETRSPEGMDGSLSFAGVRNSSMIGGNRAASILTSHYSRQSLETNVEENTSTQHNNTQDDSQRENVSGNRSTNENSSGLSIDPADLSVLITRLTHVQERSEDRHLLEARRKAMPKMSEFNGDELKWLTFKQDVERYRRNCKFDDETVKLYIRGALKGEAYTIVRDIFDIASLDDIMATLKAAYGDEMNIVRNRSDELLNFKLSSTLHKTDAVRLQAAIQAYFAACNYANIAYINTNVIAEAIFKQFNAEDRQRCKEHYCTLNPTCTTIVMDVQTIYEYLMKRMPLLDDAPIKRKVPENDNKTKSKQFQVQSVSLKSSSSERNENYKFELKDKAKAPYIGYFLDKVAGIKKECEICRSQDHYALQCTQYKNETEENRLKLIRDKGLCKNCVLTSSHRAANCDLKANCGFRMDKASRCSSKHHISIHKADLNVRQSSRGRAPIRKRHSNTKSNAEYASERINEATSHGETKSDTAKTGNFGTVAFHTLCPNDSSRQYDVRDTNSVGKINCESNNSKSVKVFKLNFFGPKGCVTAFAVGDSGSEVSLMREDLRQALGISGSIEPLHLQWADKTIKSYDAVKFEMKIQGFEKGSEKFHLQNCFAIDGLELAKRTLDMEQIRRQFPYLKDVPFDGYKDEQPVMLIGAPHAYLIEGCELVENGHYGPIAVRTRIGWSVYGGMSHQSDEKSSVKAVMEAELDDVNHVDNEELGEIKSTKVTNEELHELLVKHFSVEALGIRAEQAKFTEDETKAIALLKEEVKVLENGFVEAPLIWNRKNGDIPKLPNNYAMVHKRQLAQEKKLEKNPEHLKAYNENVEELLKLGFLREATDRDMNNDWQNVWYLPMSLVVNENKNPPKMRNVYDASATYKGESLNKNLLKGPDFLVNILQPLMKMRMNKIAFTADVKSMFNMVKICERDQQCQRILWRKSSGEPMKTYIATVMLFGPTSSPVTSQYVKNETATLWKELYPTAADTLIHYAFMDDVLTSEPSVEKALEVAKQCIEICGSINWELTAFQSNSLDLIQSLPPNVVKPSAIPFPDCDAQNCVTKVLGCYWNTAEDCFQFKLDQNIFIRLVKDFDLLPTKRDQASTLARIYDVLGLISHFTIRGKILLQRSWVNKINWDEKIDEKSAKDWKNWLQQLNEVTKLKFPRRFAQIDALSDADEVQLHIFSDAGAEAYGAVAYLVVKTQGKVETSLVMAKAKVTPLRMKTETMIKEIPRLELMAALLASRMSETIVKMLNGIKVKKYFWCDSEVVLRWLLNPNQKLLKYAVSPVEEILENSERSEWRFVPTDLNVADLCTKMKKFDFSSNTSTWMYGPEFIKKSEEHWPQIPEKLRQEDIVLVANNIFLQELNYSSYKLPPIDCPVAKNKAIEHLRASTKSSWTKLVRAVARALKLYMDVFIPLIRSKRFKDERVKEQLKELSGRLEYLSPRDLERAEHFIYRHIQRRAFPEEYALLTAGKPIKNKMMLQLNVFLDKEGIIRINSRVNLNNEGFPQQFSPLLPRKDAYVTALLEHFHYKYRHVALESQIAEIRSKVWIPQLKMALRSIKAKCNWCSLKAAKPYAPPMAPLPTDRVNPQLRPFEVVGIDVLGPLKPTINGNRKKIYILIFVCALTRYVHLHLLDSLESLRVLEAIVSFWTYYGPVRKFISDNGTNFKKTARLLQEDYERAKLFVKQHAILGPKLSELYRVEWQFNPVHAPWCGGMYERLIKEVKRSLATTLDKRKINRIELNIAVQEAAHRINCRPLIENSIDAADGEILTPHHLAKNKSGWPVLPGIHKNTYSQVPEKSIFRRGRQVADEIMRKFTSHYLPTLTKRTKWHKNETLPKVGDLVLVIEPNKTRREWQRAKIIKIHLGRDGVARVADVEMASGVIKKNRALRNLAKIKITKSLNELPVETSELDATVAGEFENTFRVNAIAACPASNKHTFSGGKKISVNRSKLNNKMPKNKKQNPQLIFQIDGIDPEMKLSEVMQAIEPEFNSVVSIVRGYDYEKQKNADFLYIQVMDSLEYLRAKAVRRLVNAEEGIDLQFPDVHFASAYFVPNFKAVEENRIQKIAKPLAVFNLETKLTATSKFVAELLAFFETKAVVTGFRWCLDSERERTRNFGFILLSSKASAMELSRQSFTISGKSLETRFTESATILLHERDSYLVNGNNKAILTEKIINANYMNVKLRASDCSAETASRPSRLVEDVSFDLPPSSLAAEIGEDSDTDIIDLECRAIEFMDYESDSYASGSIKKASKPIKAQSRAVENSGGSLKVSIPLREMPTVAVLETPSTNRGQMDSSPSTSRGRKKSKFIRIVVRQKCSVDDFKSMIGKYVKNYQIVVLFERAEESVAYIEFKEIETAHKFKKVIEGLRKDKTKCGIRYSQERGEEICELARKRTLEVNDQRETIYVFEKNGKVARRKWGKPFKDSSVAPPENVAN